MRSLNRNSPYGYKETNFIDKILVDKMFNEHKPDPIFTPKRKFKKVK